jgi:hypothetical protein
MRRRAPKTQLPPQKLTEKETTSRETPALQMALRLRFAIGHAFRCTDKECRRLCRRPVLQCELRPMADSFDWGYGWFNCQRKEVYEVRDDAWMPGTKGGSPEFRREQEDKLMEDRATLVIKNCSP